MTKEDIIWFAGLFDGEGCISVDRYKPNPKAGERSTKYRLKVRMNMCHFPTMERVHSLFGGSMLYRKGYSSRNQADQGCWSVTGAKCLSVLQIIRPYLFTKAFDADIGMEFCDLLVSQKLHKTSKLSDKDLAERDALYVKLREAKQSYKKYADNRPLKPLKRMQHV